MLYSDLESIEILGHKFTLFPKYKWCIPRKFDINIGNMGSLEETCTNIQSSSGEFPLISEVPT